MKKINFKAPPSSSKMDFIKSLGGSITRYCVAFVVSFKDQRISIHLWRRYGSCTVYRYVCIYSDEDKATQRTKNKDTLMEEI